MPWIRIEVGASAGTAEDLGERLSTLGAVSVTYLDDGDSPILEPGPWATPDPGAWSAVRVVGLFEVGADLAAVRSAFPGSPVDIEFLADRDWINNWRRFSVVRKFGRLTIVPSGAADSGGAACSKRTSAVADESAASTGDSVVLRLDPGLAFGTGSHATTRLCLEWLAARDLHARSMLDYGCGSGVLAIAARLLGAGRVVGVDHDPQALTATEANAARNGVCLLVEHSDGFLQGGVESGPERKRVTGPFDVVIANIVSGTLVELAPRLSGCLAPGGALVLSGILSDQVDEVVSAYPDVEFGDPKRLEEWVLLHGKHI